MNQINCSNDVVNGNNYPVLQKIIQLSPNLICVYGKFNRCVLYDLRSSKISNKIKLMDNHLIYSESC